MNKNEKPAAQHVTVLCLCILLAGCCNTEYRYVSVATCVEWRDSVCPRDREECVSVCKRFERELIAIPYCL